MSGFRVCLENQHPHEHPPRAPLLEAASWLLGELELPPDTEVNLFLLTDEAIQAVNRTVFGRDYPTDVIAQPLATPGDPHPLLGEVYVSLDRAREEAEARDLTPEEELLRYVFHGLLHLMGYRDDEPAARERMWARQEALLASWRAHQCNGEAGKG